MLAAIPDAAASILKVWFAAPDPTLVRTETRGPLTMSMSSAVGTVTDIYKSARFAHSNAFDLPGLGRKWSSWRQRRLEQHLVA